MKCFAVLSVALFSFACEAGTISGQAIDLRGGRIPNVTVRVFSVDGQITSQTSRAGNYKLTIADTAVPEFNQGLTVVFSSPGRETVTVNLHARSDHALNVVLPERMYGDPACAPPPVSMCAPAIYYWPQCQSMIRRCR
jgi:hypothetical protein